MSQLTKVALLLAVFFLGCVAQRLIVPPARAGTTPQRWEYACDETDPGASDAMSMANKYGGQGWEMVTTGEGGVGAFSRRVTYCFKRALP